MESRKGEVIYSDLEHMSIHNETQVDEENE